MEQYIDINTWDRKEHFDFFSQSDMPLYSITTEIDVTGLRKFAKANKTSFYLSLVYVCTKAMIRVKNFRYRIRGDKVVLLDDLRPSFTHMDKGAELFKYVSYPAGDDILEFCRKAKEKATAKDYYMDDPEDLAYDDFIYITCLPWFTFTSITLDFCLNKDDCIPRLTWGKYFERDGKTLLNLGVQVNHRIIDGYHIGLFLDELNKELAAYNN